MPWLIIQEGENERPLELHDGPFLLGRAAENQVVLAEKQASRRHCQIDKTPAGYKLVDLESRNGTRVNGTFVNQHLLRDGDLVTIGETQIRFLENEPTSRRSASTSLSATRTRAAAVTETREDDSAPPPRRTGSSVDRKHARRAVEAARRSEHRLIAWTITGVGFLAIVLVLLYAANRLRRTDDSRTARNRDAESPPPTRAEGPEWEAFQKVDRLRDQRRPDFDLLIAACQEFLQQYPAGVYARTVESYLEEAQRDKRAGRLREVRDLEQNLVAYMKRSQFVPAMQEVQRLSAKYRDDVDALPAILACQAQVLEEVRKYYEKIETEAKALANQGELRMAERLYREAQDQLGSGRTEGLEDFCRRAEAAIQALTPTQP